MAEVSYLTFGDDCRIAAEVLGTTPEQIARLPRIALADSALASPRAGFGGQEAYPALIEKAAVLVEHLTRNHPLPDGNKRCAFLALERFLRRMGSRSAMPTPTPTCRWWSESPPAMPATARLSRGWSSAPVPHRSCPSDSRSASATVPEEYISTKPAYILSKQWQSTWLT